MNERIKELEAQCWEPRQYGPAWFNSTKFAELIVRECIGCCEQVISDPVPESVDTWLNGGLQCIQEIKHHFGMNNELR